VVTVSGGWGGSTRRRSGAKTAPERRLPGKTVMPPTGGRESAGVVAGLAGYASADLRWPVVPWRGAPRYLGRLAEVGGTGGYGRGGAAVAARRGTASC
jgi:hypothetical protein